MDCPNSWKGSDARSILPFRRPVRLPRKERLTAATPRGDFAKSLCNGGAPRRYTPWLRDPGQFPPAKSVRGGSGRFSGVRPLEGDGTLVVDKACRARKSAALSQNRDEHNGWRDGCAATVLGKSSTRLRRARAVSGDRPRRTGNAGCRSDARTANARNPCDGDAAERCVSRPCPWQLGPGEPGRSLWDLRCGGIDSAREVAYAGLAVSTLRQINGGTDNVLTPVGQAGLHGRCWAWDLTGPAPHQDYMGFISERHIGRPRNSGNFPGTGG